MYRVESTTPTGVTSHGPPSLRTARSLAAGSVGGLGGRRCPGMLLWHVTRSLFRRRTPVLSNRMKG